MAIKTYRPITPTLRFKTTLVNDDLTTDKPHKPLLAVRKRTGGRRNSGDLTIRHHGGGHKQKIRLIDFKRDKSGVPGKVATIEYDPNRSARIALVHYADGEKRYILQPVGLKVGRDGDLRSRGRHPGRQCAAAQEHSCRHHGARD